MTSVIALSNRTSRYVPTAIGSLIEHVPDAKTFCLVDDSGDADWRDYIAMTLPGTVVVPVAAKPAGYTAAMAKVWEVARHEGQRFLFLEEDFRFTRHVDLEEMQAILDDNPRLAQIALQRAPWYRREKRIGVLAAQRERVDRERRNLNLPPTKWIDHSEVDICQWGSGDVVRHIMGGYIEHNAGITGNPALWSTAALEFDWPQVEWSETAMGDQIHAAGMTSAWFGGYGDPPHVEHVGNDRAETSTGY